MLAFFLVSADADAKVGGDKQALPLSTPSRPKRIVTLRDLNVEQDQALWRSILTTKDAAIEPPTAPTSGRNMRPTSGIDMLASSGRGMRQVDPGSTGPSLDRGSPDRRSLDRPGRSPDVHRSLSGLFGSDDPHAEVENVRRRHFIDRAFEVTKQLTSEIKAGGSVRPGRSMQVLSSQPRPAATKKLDEAMAGAAGVEGCAGGVAPT